MIFERKKFFDLTAYRLGRFYSATNLAVYFFSLPNIYIDSAQSSMQKKFKEIAVKDKPEFCFLTHYHEDHAGNAPLLKSLFKTKIVAHKKSAKYLKKQFKMLPYEKIIWGRLQQFEPDLYYDKETFDAKGHKFKIINTPGHSEDSVCILDADRGWLFSGDLYISSKPKYLRTDENIYEILKSLKIVSKLEFEVLFCAHKGILEKSPKKLINAKIEYMETMIYNVKKLYKEGFSPKKIRDILLGREGLTSYLTYLDFCKMNFISSILKDEQNQHPQS